MSSPAPTQQGTALSRAMRPLNTVVERFIPSALVFAIALTFVVGVLALVLTDAGPKTVVQGWGDGLSGLLAFITQMSLILLLGHTLAHTRPVRALLRRLGSVPSTVLQAYVFVFVVASVASLITWGLGLVVGALLAKEVARQGREKGLRLHFPMLVAAGYSGYVLWHMGYSGSAPLTAATPDSFISEQLGAPLPISETTFAWWNIVAALATIVVVGLALYLVAPRDGDKVVELAGHGGDDAPDADEAVETPADRVDASRVPTLALGLLTTAYLVLHFGSGGSLTLDIVNWTFLALILLLVRNPFELIALVKNAASNVGEILLQFPLYAGILGIMTSLGPDRGALRRDHRHLDAADLRAARLPLGRPGQLLRALGRRPARRAGSGAALGGREPRRRPVGGDHGALLRRPVDQHDPAVLGPAAAGHRGAEDARHPRLHHGHPARLGAGLRRHAAAGLGLTDRPVVAVRAAIVGEWPC